MQQLAMGSNPKLESKLSLSSEIYHSDQVLTEPLGEQLWVAGIYKTEVSPPLAAGEGRVTLHWGHGLRYVAQASVDGHIPTVHMGRTD